MQLGDAEPVIGLNNRRFQHPGMWFWVAMSLGAAIRLYFVLFTQGTYDVGIWRQHAAGVNALGLIGYYHAEPTMNHPPFISLTEAFFLRAAEISGIPFRIWLRLPFACLDAGTTLLLLLLMRSNPWRFVVAAGYWLNPLAMIFSAYHGNTDSAVAFFVLLSVWLLSKEKTVAAAVAIGASFWIKLPGILAVPALFFFVKGWRNRFVFIVVVGLTAIVTYLPALLQDSQVVYANVFGYRGQIIQTTAGIRVWGLYGLISSWFPAFKTWPSGVIHAIIFLLQYGWQLALGLLGIFVWLRRSARSVAELCVTIAGVYAIVYGFSNNWSFQYFAWAVPFWFFLPAPFYVAASVVAGGYIYSLYWLLCGNPWLLGEWDFVGHPHWPVSVMSFRNLAVLFFFISAGGFLIFAFQRQFRDWLKANKNAGQK